MTWLILAFFAVWLGLLSFVVWSLAKYVGALELARMAGPIPRLQYDFDADGPAVGGRLPQAVLNLVPAAVTQGDAFLFVLSPGCGTCLEVAEDVVRRPQVTSASVFIVPGPSDTGAARELRRILERARPLVIDRDDARLAMRELAITSVPFVVRLRDGVVRRKAFLRKSVALNDVLAGAEDELTGGAIERIAGRSTS